MKEPTIALSGSGFLITFPSDVSGLTHSIEIPPTEGGIRALRKALSARGITKADRRIGTAASPTQAMVNEWLEADRRERAAKPLIADLDLASIDLDL